MKSHNPSLPDLRWLHFKELFNSIREQGSNYSFGVMMVSILLDINPRGAMEDRVVPKEYGQRILIYGFNVMTLDDRNWDAAPVMSCKMCKLLWTAGHLHMYFIRRRSKADIMQAGTIMLSKIPNTSIPLMDCNPTFVDITKAVGHYAPGRPS